MTTSRLAGQRTLITGGTTGLGLATAKAFLADVLSTRPLDRGLEELVAYLHLSEGDFDTVVDDSRTDTVSWTGPDGKQRTARMARVIYVHTGSGAHDDSGDLP